MDFFARQEQARRKTKWLVLYFMLAVMLLMHSLWPSLLGAAVVLAGLPVRWLLLRNKQLAPEMATETELL